MPVGEMRLIGSYSQMLPSFCFLFPPFRTEPSLIIEEQTKTEQMINGSSGSMKLNREEVEHEELAVVSRDVDREEPDVRRAVTATANHSMASRRQPSLYGVESIRLVLFVDMYLNNPCLCIHFFFYSFTGKVSLQGLYSNIATRCLYISSQGHIQSPVSGRRIAIAE